MKIAIQASDLDHRRVDGTRVYIFNLLKYFGKLDKESEFWLYHKNDFNPELTPPKFFNYKIIQKTFPFLWTQFCFAIKLWKDKPDILWMPMHNMPIVRRKNLKTIVTIHDLAFKKFPETFPQKDLFQLNLLTGLAVRRADKIIAVSQSTQRDIEKFYPEIKKEKIKVIYHGFDAKLFQQKFSVDQTSKILNRYKLKTKSYFLYVGAIQPRKNLEVLVRAFEVFKQNNQSDLKLVLAGGKAWNCESMLKTIEKSIEKNNIVLTGNISFEDLAVIYREATLFVFPSLYEGFGIPVLEAFAAKIPSLVARNSSLPEVAGEAAEYFSGNDEKELAFKMEQLFFDSSRQEKLIKKGLIQLEKFSWEKCAKETLQYLKH